ncbi:MAG: DUF938 domain-containing protein [Gammaproteobacteria bacterium]|nr:DUF938 domain-containing protein [Gammaproteobacteria bacterium]MBU1554237.1 DUF938 domain-containing protein [Gammaproteobacteria bacterium]MBU2072698.1 DUF938 domain-containing protein [Gammaproteobacteria bacterium]MBU2182168.1 DUF938 domain-containing protein [Gammaproteobacteria bacterium]MBU2204782.1 DUF938 domain-containing protein [Gammaproteobacteria bacterium]
MLYPDLPYSQACENNKAPILAVLQQAFAASSKVLEVGSGTGQHAEYFATHLAHLTWQASEQPQYLAPLAERLRRAGLANLPLPVALDICQDTLPKPAFDALFSANTLHIMPWNVVKQFFSRLNQLLSQPATLCIYGPFNYNDNFTSDSNRMFDQSLKSRDPAMGIRDCAAVVALAAAEGFTLQHDHSMPANNRLLQFVSSKR